MTREPIEYVLVTGDAGQCTARLLPEHLNRWRVGELDIYMRRDGRLLELRNAEADEYSEWRPVT